MFKIIISTTTQNLHFHCRVLLVRRWRNKFLREGRMADGTSRAGGHFTRNTRQSSLPAILAEEVTGSGFSPFTLGQTIIHVGGAKPPTQNAIGTMGQNIHGK